MSKKSFVATATAVGLVVDGARMPVYLAGQYREMSTLWVMITTATAGVAAGTLLGSHVLSRIPNMWFHRVLAVVLAALGTAMVVRGVLNK